MSGEGFVSLDVFGDSRLMFLPIETIQLRNLLSFVRHRTVRSLRTFNVLIGANGSGSRILSRGLNYFMR